MSVPPVKTPAQRPVEYTTLQRTEKYRDIWDAFKNFSPEQRDALVKTVQVFSAHTEKKEP